MGRQPCFIPENDDGVLVELTGRTIGARSFLVPSPNPRIFNEMVVGVLGRAREVSPLELCSVVVTGNHWHGLVVIHDQQQLSRFMHHFCCNLTKEVNRWRGRRGPLWARRYDRIVVSGEPEVQWARLRYHLSHGVKEGLTESPLDWPGVHAARALVHGENLEGFWFNRAKEWSARNRGLEVGTYDYATKYLVGLAPLPAFRHLTPEEYQAKVAELIHEIEEEGKAKHPMAGVEKVLSQDPYERPTRKTKTSTRPLFHVKDPEVRRDLRAELHAFLAKYYDASEVLRSTGTIGGSMGFPAGCYPPALPFTGGRPPLCPPPPPTRTIVVLEATPEQPKMIERGPIPVVELPTRIWAVGPLARGEPL